MTGEKSCEVPNYVETVDKFVANECIIYGHKYTKTYRLVTMGLNTVSHEDKDLRPKDTNTVIQSKLYLSS